MQDLNRRGLLGAALLVSATPLTATAQATPPVLAPRPGPARADDTRYWDAVAAQFDVTRQVIQLENGNWGMMARPVLAAYNAELAKVNRDTSYYSRRALGPDLAPIHARVAANLGVSQDEIIFTRGATESLLTLIAGYNRLRPGDKVMSADLDYDSTQAAFVWLKAHRGVGLVTFDLPSMPTHQGLIDAYDAALTANPDVRLMLLTHVGHRTGLVMPVAEIMDVARRHKVDVIVDSAHAWGQLDFRLPDLKADFIGLTCQKWIGAPLGVGVMYVRRDRIGDIDLAMGNEPIPSPDRSSELSGRLHTGTRDFAALLAVGDALDFHERIGAGAKELRLRYLRNLWAEQIRGYGAIEVLTPSDPRLTCAITSFRLKGHVSVEDNRALAAKLLKDFNIFTVERSGVASGSCVRITPAIFTHEDEIAHLLKALKTLA